MNFLYNNALPDAGCKPGNITSRKENNKYKVHLKPYIYFVKPKKEELSRFEYKKAIFLGSTLKSDIKININDTDRNGFIISNFYIEDPDVTDKKFRDAKLLNRRRYGFKPFKGEYVTDLFYAPLQLNNTIIKFRYYWLLCLPVAGLYKNNLELNSFGFNPVLKRRPHQFSFTSYAYYGNTFGSTVIPFFFADFASNYLFCFNVYDLMIRFGNFRFGRRNRFYKLLGLQEKFYLLLSKQNYFTVLRMSQYSVFYSLMCEKATEFIRRFRRRFHYEKWIGTMVTRFVLFKSRRKLTRFPFFFSKYRYLKFRYFSIKSNLKYLFHTSIRMTANFKYTSGVNYLFRKIFIKNLNSAEFKFLIYFLFTIKLKISLFCCTGEFKNLFNTIYNYGLRNQLSNKFRLYIKIPLFKSLTVKYYSNCSKIVYADTTKHLPYILLKARYNLLRFRVLNKSFFKLFKILCIIINFSFRIAKIGFNHLKYWKLFRKISDAVFIRLRLIRIAQSFFFSILGILLRKNFHLINLSSFIYFYIKKATSRLNLFEKFFILFLPNFLKNYYYGFKSNLTDLRLRFANADSFLAPKIWYKRLYQRYLFSTEVDEDFYTIFLSNFYFLTPIPFLFKNTLIKNYRQTRTNFTIFNPFDISSRFDKKILKFKNFDRRFRYFSIVYRDTVVNNLDDQELGKSVVDNLASFRAISRLFKTMPTSASV